MNARRSVTTDDVITRLQAMPAELWDLPEAPPLNLDVGALMSAPSARSGGRAFWTGWLSRLGGPFMLRPATAFAAAAVLVLAGVGGTSLLRDGGSGGTSYDGDRVQLSSLPGFDGATATAAMNVAKTEMELKVAGLPALKPGEYYELWALNSPKELAPVGTFRVAGDGTAKVDFAVGVDASKYAGLDISIEPNDGNPAHSGRSVVRSALPA